MLEKLHLVSKIILICIILYYIWEYISGKIGIYLLKKEKSVRSSIVKTTLNSPENKRILKNKFRKYLLIVIGAGLVLYIIW